MHSIETSNAATKRNQLNKRVSHTLSGLNPNQTDQNVSENANANVLTAPPTTSLTTPPITSSSDKTIEKAETSTSQSTGVTQGDEISIEEIENILNTNVNILKDNDLGVSYIKIT